LAKEKNNRIKEIANMRAIRKLLQIEYVALFIILFSAAFLRLYRIGDYMTFLGDEGRDALIVKGILEGDLTLLGPRASAGDFFLGPIYYYFMAPFLWLWRYDPVGPAVMVALFGIATVFLVYYVGKEFFGRTAGLFAASLYAVSPVVIAYSRSSWNPNPMPFFSILTLFLLYKALRRENKVLLLSIGVLLGVSLQLHYLATFLSIIILFYLIAVRFLKGTGKQVLSVFQDVLLLLGGFVIGLSPFLAFEIKHGFPNIRTIIGFILQNLFRSSPEANSTFTHIVSNVFFRVFGRLMTRYPPPEQVSVAADKQIAMWYFFTLALALFSISVFCWQLYKLWLKKDREKIMEYLLIGSWFVLGVMLFGFYKKPIYDYYFGFLFPVPFLLVGNALASILQAKQFRIITTFFAVAVFCYLLVFNLQGAPFFSSPNKQKDQVKMIAEFVLSKTEGKPYNFALITKGNSDHAYRYFFELAHHPPVTIENLAVDPLRKSVTDQLLVVCEDPTCQPLGNALWEIAGFGRAEIVGQWDVSVVKVYKLRHYSVR
jgi:4-amino-4-deoxy-L-arabinose transferase-like glycosyltransferase